MSSSVTLATLAKITQDRAEELALLALSSRYQTVGFDARTREVQSWCDKTALEIGEKSPDLMHFYSQFIIPHLPGSRFRGAQAMISETAVRRIALKLVYLECADFRTIVDRVTKFLTRHPNVSKSEIISLLHHYLVPHYLEKLQ